MTTHEVKLILIECLVGFLAAFQARRAAVTDEMVATFMQQRQIDLIPEKFRSK